MTNLYAKTKKPYKNSIRSSIKCKKNADETIRAYMHEGHELPRGKMLRLAVLERDPQHVTELLKTLPPRSMTKAPSWGDQSWRMNYLQAALDDAASTDQPKIIKKLVDYGANPDRLTMVSPIPAIMAAAECGSIASMNTLYELGAYPSLFARNVTRNAPGNAIETAIFSRQNEAVRWLINHGVNVCSDYESKRIDHFMKAFASKKYFSKDVQQSLQCINKN